MLLNGKRFRDEDILSKLIKNAETHYKELKFFDLDLVNITCQNIKPLNFRYCVLQGIYYNEEFHRNGDYKYLKNIYSNDKLINAKSNPAIIHYAGKPGKPWRMNNPYADYKALISEMPKELKRYTFRDLRKKLFNREYWESNLNLLLGHLF